MHMNMYAADAVPGMDRQRDRQKLSQTHFHFVVCSINAIARLDCCCCCYFCDIINLYLYYFFPAGGAAAVA